MGFPQERRSPRTPIGLAETSAGSCPSTSLLPPPERLQERIPQLVPRVHRLDVTAPAHTFTASCWWTPSRRAQPGYARPPSLGSTASPASSTGTCCVDWPRYRARLPRQRNAVGTSAPQRCADYRTDSCRSNGHPNASHAACDAIQTALCRSRHGTSCRAASNCSEATRASCHDAPRRRPAGVWAALGLHWQFHCCQRLSPFAPCLHGVLELRALRLRSAIQPRQPTLESLVRHWARFGCS